MQQDNQLVKKTQSKFQKKNKSPPLIQQFIMFENLMQKSSEEQEQEEEKDRKERIQKKFLINNYNKQRNELSLSPSVFILGKVNLSNSEIIGIADTNWKNLRSLMICNSNIGPEGIRLLTINGWDYLQQLYISENKLGDEGAKILSKGQWPSLRILNIGSNEIRNDGLILLINGLWQRVTQLSIFYNRQSQLGLFLIARLYLPRISVVYSWMSYMEDVFEESIAEALQHLHICL